MQEFPPRAAGAAPTTDGAEHPLTVTSRLWYSAHLSDAPIGERHVPMIAEHFLDALGASGWPDGACLFLCGNNTLFFSPAAIAAVPHLIVVCGARPSPPPDRACATLVAGRESDRELLLHDLH